MHHYKTFSKFSFLKNGYCVVILTQRDEYYSSESQFECLNVFNINWRIKHHSSSRAYKTLSLILKEIKKTTVSVKRSYNLTWVLYVLYN